MVLGWGLCGLGMYERLMYEDIDVESMGGVMETAISCCSVTLLVRCFWVLLRTWAGGRWVGE